MLWNKRLGLRIVVILSVLLAGCFKFSSSIIVGKNQVYGAESGISEAKKKIKEDIKKKEMEIVIDEL